MECKDARHNNVHTTHEPTAVLLETLGMWSETVQYDEQVAAMYHAVMDAIEAVNSGTHQEFISKDNTQ